MHTSEEDDCEDLPSITVNSSAINSSAFVMPSAEELAEQRARELERERQLEELHRRAQRDERVAELRHSDSGASSGSEGELALAAAAAALRVQDAPRAAPSAAALWAALAPQLPPAAAELQPAAAPAQLPRAVRALAAALAASAGAWPDDELQCGAALLCVAAAARDSRARRPAARTLHALLDDCATPAQVSRLTCALLAALPAARVRLQLGDVLRSGGGGGADRAARALCEAALLALLGGEPAREAGPSGWERVARAAAAWRACGAEARGVCVRLAARLLAGAGEGEGEGEARARLLAQLAPPPAAASDAHRPDRLKASVGASKLQLLFSGKNSSSKPQAQRVTSTSTSQKMELENNS